jgi:hypothetical protein
MEGSGGLIEIGAAGGTTALFAVMLYRAIDIFKSIAYFLLPDKWVDKFPKWIWLMFSIAIGVGASMYFKIDAVSELTGAANIPFEGTHAQAATGFLIATSSNVVNHIENRFVKKEEPVGAVSPVPIEREEDIYLEESISEPIEEIESTEEIPPLEESTLKPILLVEWNPKMKKRPEYVIVDDEVKKL